MATNVMAIIVKFALIKSVTWHEHDIHSVVDDAHLIEMLEYTTCVISTQIRPCVAVTTRDSLQRTDFFFKQVTPSTMYHLVTLSLQFLCTTNVYLHFHSILTTTTRMTSLTFHISSHTVLQFIYAHWVKWSSVKHTLVDHALWYEIKTSSPTNDPHSSIWLILFS